MLEGPPYEGTPTYFFLIVIGFFNLSIREKALCT